MQIGVITKNENSWCSRKIIKYFKSKDAQIVAFSLPEVVARVGFKPESEVRGINIKSLDGILVRPIGPGSLDEIIFRIDILHRIGRLGVPVTNSPFAIERAADKYFTLTLLEDNGIPIPRTLVTESVPDAMETFSQFGKEVVIKPIFGSRGLGITRTSDSDVARRICTMLSYNHFVLYLQEFVQHGNRDIRTMVVGDKVVAAMYRKCDGWKTNISQGATPIAFKPDEEMEALSIKASKAVGCEIAGVDIMESENGLLVHEINSQPGFRGLQIASEVNVAGEIADYIIQKTKR
ncbi:MAG: RimK family alpha-L-glutamate ligase [Candidatus Bathyarchaeota archaeon]